MTFYGEMLSLIAVFVVVFAAIMGLARLTLQRGGTVLYALVIATLADGLVATAFYLNVVQLLRN